MFILLTDSQRFREDLDLFFVAAKKHVATIQSHRSALSDVKNVGRQSDQLTTTRKDKPTLKECSNTNSLQKSTLKSAQEIGTTTESTVISGYV